MNATFYLPNGQTVASDIIRDSFSLTEVYHKNLSQADNSCVFSAPFTIELANALKSFMAADIRAEVSEPPETEGGEKTVLFMGYVRKKTGFTKRIRNGPIKIELVSPSFLLDKDIGRPLMFMDKPLKDIVEALARAAGCDAAVSAPGTTVPFASFREDDSALDCINELLFEYGHTFDFTPDGELHANPLFDSPPETITQEFRDGRDGNMYGEVTQSVRERSCDMVSGSYDEVAYIEDTLLFEDTGTKDIPAGGYLYGSAPGARAVYDSPDGEVRWITEITRFELRQIGGMSCEYENYGTGAVVTVHNPLSVSRRFDSLRIYGNGYVSKSTNVVKTGSTGKTKELKLRYTTTEDAARETVANVCDWYKYACFNATLKSSANYPAGSFCTVSAEGMGTFAGRIVQRKARLDTDLIEYTVESRAEFTPAEPVEKTAAKSASAAKMAENLGNELNALASGESVSVPAPRVPTGVSATATRDALLLECDVPESGLSSGGKVVYQILFPQEEWEDAPSVTGRPAASYPLLRHRVGYPEADELSGWRVRAKSRNQFGQESAWSEPVFVGTGSYGTWIPGKPSVAVRVSGRAVTLSFSQPARADGRELYGALRHRVRIRKPPETEWRKPATGADPYGDPDGYKDGDGFVYAGTSYTQVMQLAGQDYMNWCVTVVLGWDSDEPDGEGGTKSVHHEKSSVSYTELGKWDDPDTDGKEALAGKLAELFGIEASPSGLSIGGVQVQLRTGDGGGALADWGTLRVGGTLFFSLSRRECPQGVPFCGSLYENAQAYMTPEYGGLPTDTAYQFEVTPENETGAYLGADHAAIVDAVAAAISAKDLVNEAVTTNKLARDCITGDKIHAGTITADKIAVSDLSAISGTFGKIGSSGMGADSSNFWDLETGEFCVGTTSDTETPNDSDSFFHYIPSSGLFMKLSSLVIKGIRSAISGMLYVKKPGDADSASFMVANPTASADGTTGTPAKTLRVDGRIEVAGNVDVTTAAASGIVNKLATSTTAITDDEYLVSTESASSTAQKRKKFSVLWTWIKGKLTGAKLSSSNKITATNPAKMDGVITIHEVYNADGPAAYGNLINVGGRGGTQIFQEWSGGQSSAGQNVDQHLWIRSQRDNQSAFTGWKKVANTDDIPSMSSILLAAHPVGSYYWSSVSTDPGTLFGGTWTRVKDRFVYALGDSGSVGATGGEAEHSLTLLEMPLHKHRVDLAGVANSNGTHSHTVSYYGDNMFGSTWNIRGVVQGSYIGSARVSDGGAHTHSVNIVGDTEYTGSGGKHNNMPPYITAYCWKRTA